MRKKSYQHRRAIRRFKRANMRAQFNANMRFMDQLVNLRNHGENREISCDGGLRNEIPSYQQRVIDTILAGGRVVIARSHRGGVAYEQRRLVEDLRARGIELHQVEVIPGHSITVGRAIEHRTEVAHFGRKSEIQLAWEASFEPAFQEPPIAWDPAKPGADQHVEGEYYYDPESGMVRLRATTPAPGQYPQIDEAVDNLRKHLGQDPE